ncbi:MAG: MerR family transcriptional regulator [Defluviitaleaceae bacterium]|nr:MerR family transcriptional regulator [Defluviitaleaceae bacterium]
MGSLAKIADVASKYDVTARALRYYEDAGLLESVRIGDHAYRHYDEAAVRRLEQILILRKLNVSIRDIKRVFNADGPGAVLEVLGKKVDSIDNDVAMLRELREIIADFIREIERADFSGSSEIKMLYDKAREIETKFIGADYAGKPSKAKRLAELAEGLDKKIPDVMIINIQKFRAATSGLASWEEVFGAFNEWREAHDHLFKAVLFDSSNFLTGEGDLVEWFWGIGDDVTEQDVAPYAVTEFCGGLYAVAVSVDADGESHGKVRQKTKKWLETTNFVEDTSRRSMGNVIYPIDEIKKGLGYHQMNLYLPIKLGDESRRCVAIYGFTRR